MVSAVSSQAATLNPLAYTALDGDDNSKQPASNATPNDSDRGPATQVSLSQDALDRLMAAFKQGPDAAQQALGAWSQAGADRLAAVQAHSDEIHRQFAIDQVNFQLKMLDQQDATNESFTASLKSQKEDLDKWQNTTPVPAVQLTAAQIADVLKKAAPLGIDPSKIGGADNYIFGIDGVQYTFKKDGTAWMNEGGVPTSEEQKKYVPQESNKSMAYQSTRIQDTSAARVNLTAQLNALMGQ
jgi:hypothetical protein